ncbi:unnamed protein product [Orchesella dallaii]|uniref:Uncharacterized protein n=1 Tax=Orchesella dallaii TaxID=48710 RepID=A0ABP1RIB6_9HEXA
MPYYRIPIFEKATKIRNIILFLHSSYAVFEICISPLFFITLYNQDWYVLFYILPTHWKEFCVGQLWPLAIVSILTTWFEATQWGGGATYCNCTMIYLQNAATTMKFLG